MKGFVNPVDLSKFLKLAHHWSGYYLILLSLGVLSLSLWVPFENDQQNVLAILQGPSGQHLMGTDKLGRDLFSRILFGANISIWIGILPAFISVVVGFFWGCLAVFGGKIADTVLMRTLDIFDAIPSLIFIILTKTVFDVFDEFWGWRWPEIFSIFLALSIVGWMRTARLVRAELFKIRKLTYIEASRALGCTRWRSLWHHILPSLSGILIIAFVFRIPVNILYESFLSYIGLGLQAPMSSWGTLASEGANSLASYPHLTLFPGGVLFITLIAMQAFADRLKGQSAFL